MKNLFLILLISCGATNRLSAQDTTALRPWDHIVDFYTERLRTIEHLPIKPTQEPLKNSLEEEKISFLQKNKLLLKIKFDKELIRRKDPASIYRVRGGNWEYNTTDLMYLENIFDSLLTSMIPRDAEGRIKKNVPLTTFAFATTGNNCQQSLSLSTISDSLFTVLVWEKPAVKKIHQKVKTVPAKQRKISTFDFNQKITLNMGGGIGEKPKTTYEGNKNENLKNKLKGNWCNHFYKDEKGKEMWKLFPSAGLMSGCTGIGFFENDSCKEYFSGMLSFFGTLSKKKTNFSVKDDVLTFTIKTSEGKTEFERYKIIKADENEILLEKINTEIRTAVPFLLIEPEHCRNGGMGDAGTAK